MPISSYATRLESYNTGVNMPAGTDTLLIPLGPFTEGSYLFGISSPSVTGLAAGDMYSDMLSVHVYQGAWCGIINPVTLPWLDKLINVFKFPCWDCPIPGPSPLMGFYDPSDAGMCCLGEGSSYAPEAEFLYSHRPCSVESCTQMSIRVGAAKTGAYKNYGISFNVTMSLIGAP